MRKSGLLYVILLLILIGCNSDNDSSTTENGRNPAPNQKPTGSSAKDFLTDKYEELEIEIVYVEGYRPTTQSINNLRTFLQQRLNKPGGITVVQREVPSPDRSPYSLSEINKLESELRSSYNDVNKLSLYVFFADGRFTTDTPGTFTLGTAYRNTSCVIYENTIINYSSLPGGPDRTALETTVLLHEICHLLGLVNFGTPMLTAHEDPAQRRHCTNSDCLMYWQAQMIVNGNIPQLDSSCIADLRANGGK
jgi:predicted Zn-dependent protease